MVRWTICICLLWLVGLSYGEVAYATEPEAVEDQQENTVNRETDGKSGPAHLHYAPLCKIHNSYSTYCSYRKPGLFTYDADYNCYIQCDEWHRTFIKPCAYGTYWKPDGYEPTMYNRCVGIKPHPNYVPPPPPPKPVITKHHSVKSTTHVDYGTHGQVHHHQHQQAHVQRQGGTPAPPKPLHYNNLVDMYIHGKPQVNQYAGRELAEDNGQGNNGVANAPAPAGSSPQIHQITPYQQQAAAQMSLPQPQSLPKLQISSQPVPQRQALPPIAQQAPQPQQVPYQHMLQQQHIQGHPQQVLQHPQQVRPPQQVQPQQIAMQAQQQARLQHAQAQRQQIQLVPQNIQMVPSIPPSQAIKPVLIVQPTPNIDNRITLNSRFPLSGHSNPNQVNSQGLTSNKLPGLTTQKKFQLTHSAGGQGQLRRPGAIKRMRNGLRRRGGLLRRKAAGQNGVRNGPNRARANGGGQGLNANLMAERRRRLSQWQKYLRNSKGKGNQNHLNGAGGGEGPIITARRRMFDRRNQRAITEEDTDPENEFLDDGSQQGGEEREEQEIETDEEEEEGDYGDGGIGDDEYIDLNNFLVNDEPNIDESHDGYNYENYEEESNDENEVEKPLDDNASNSVETSDNGSTDVVIDTSDFNSHYIIHNLPDNIPDNIPK